MKKIIVAFLFLNLIPGLFDQAMAYPDFIGYGYRSCLTCHFNGFGGGPLNDYGRALFGNLISSRALLNDSYNDDKLSDESGFFMATQGPWWLKPGAKYRGLFVQSNPGSNQAVSRYIGMQADLNAAVFADENQKLAFVGSVGYQPRPTRLSGTSESYSSIISREYYLRYAWKPDLWIYAGLLDKVYGLRTNDHVTFARAKVGIAQSDQSHGVVVHWLKEKSDLAVHLFAGNLGQDAELRQKGFTLFYESEVDERKALGGSLMYSKNNFVSWTRASTHYKQGFGEGTSFIGELGLIQNKPENGGASKLGSYLLTQSLFRMTRGYNLMMQFEHYNEEFKSTSPDLYRWGVGFLTFPVPRAEVRLLAQNQRGISQVDFVEDTWNVQGQLHVSW